MNSASALEALLRARDLPGQVPGRGEQKRNVGGATERLVWLARSRAPGGAENRAAGPLFPFAAFRDHLQPGAVGPHHRQIRAFTGLSKESDVLAVRRPGRTQVATAAKATAATLGQLAHATAVCSSDEDIRAVV